MKNYKISFFGAGNIYKKHFNAIKKKKFSLINIYEKKNNLKKNKFLNSEKNILNNQGIDIISVLSPSGEHFQQTKKILVSKKNAIVEKPLALKINHIQNIIKLENKFKRKVFVVFQHRLNPAYLKLKSLLKQKKLGKIFLISSRLYWSRHDNYYKNNWKGTWKYDGGVVTNQGIHTIDLITQMFGQFKKIFARSNTISKFIETEDVCIVTGELKNKILCNMEFTTSTRPSNLENSITILGTKGYFKISGKNLDQYSSNFNKKIVKVKIDNLHQKFYDEVYSTLTKNLKNNFSAKSSLISLKTVVGIYKSFKYRKEIKFPLKKISKIKLGE